MAVVGMEKIRVLGIDPGYAIAGYGILDAGPKGLAPVTFGAITTVARTELAMRLCEIYDDFMHIIDQYHPNMAAVETLFYSKNQTTAVAVAEARGVILLALQKSGVPFFEYSPLQVKQGVVGYGKATKAQVQDMVRRHLGLAEAPKPDDAADALAIAICHANSSKSALFGKRETKLRQMGYY